MRLYYAAMALGSDHPITIFRNASEAESNASGMAADPILVSGQRRRVVAFAGFSSVVFGFAFFVDVLINVYFGAAALAPERFKSVAMCAFTGAVCLSAKRSTSMRAVITWSYAMVLVVACYTSADAL